MEFLCNICGRKNTRSLSDFGRETPSCDGCGSSVRARAVVHMLSRELFGTELALPDFPRVKAIRGIGLSDSCYDHLLAEKFDYRNTHYHKEPHFDIVNMTAEHEGAYDFLVSSEVFEHVAPPVATAFRNTWRALKPNGVLLLTVPYTLENKTAEHFPELFDYGLAQLSDRFVLVNSTRDGQLQVFEDLCFHGGQGSTLEIRRFTEGDLRRTIREAGFLCLEIYAASYPPFGIVRTENWSLPMAARKQPFAIIASAAGEIIEQWGQQLVQYRKLDSELKRRTEWAQDLASQLEQRTQWAQDLASQMEERTQWAQDLESQLEERTQWAQNLDRERLEHAALIVKLQAEYAERTEWALRYSYRRSSRLIVRDAMNYSSETRAYCPSCSSTDWDTVLRRVVSEVQKIPA